MDVLVIGVTGEAPASSAPASCVVDAALRLGFAAVDA
jgi:hypothetical protein